MEKRKKDKSHILIRRRVPSIEPQANNYRHSDLNHFDRVVPKCDTSSNDTSSNEPFRLKVTSSKWHFVDCAHCRKTGSSNSFDEKNS